MSCSCMLLVSFQLLCYIQHVSFVLEVKVTNKGPVLVICAMICSLSVSISVDICVKRPLSSQGFYAIKSV